MYRSVYYDYSTYTYFLDDDEKGRLEFQYRPTYYKRVQEPDDRSFPVLTGGWANPTQKYDKHDPDLLEKDINKELLILRDLYYKEEDIVPKNHRTVFLDIEIEIGGMLTPDYIRAAPMPFTSISMLYDGQEICFILDPLKEIEEIIDTKRHIIPCHTEVALAKAFLNKLNSIDPTIIVTWNGEFFDIPYLYFRLQNIVGYDEALRLSPIRKIQEKSFDPNSPIRLGGVNHLDYLLLFKKYITKQEPSYKLGDIGDKYVNLGKIEYEGNLNQLYRDDIDTFIEYNIRDCEIMKRLDDKLKFIDLTIMLSHICNIPYDSIYYNTVMNEGAILKYLKNEKIVSPNKPTTHNPARKGKEESYSGGYLLDPIPGLYNDVIDLDFTSLYPSIIKSLNLGIETLVGRILSPNPNYEKYYSLEKLKERDPAEEVTIQKLDKNNYTLKSTSIQLGKIIAFIEENNYTVAASGGIFRTDEQSVCSKILQRWFEKREHYRGLKKKAGKEEDWSNYKLYDLFQHAFKILQNAMYGTYAINSWRYTDGHMICSSAITNTGQRLDMESIDFVNDKLNCEYNTNRKYVIQADTDSMYIELEDIINTKYPHISDFTERNLKILDLAQELQQASNNYLSILCPKLFNIPINIYFQLKQEVIATSLLSTGKRRYAMFITNKEGVPIPADHDDALDMKGLELMKSNMNKLFKEFGTNFIKQILFKTPKHKLDQSIIDFYKHLQTLDPRVLGKPTGVKQLFNYIAKPSTDTRMFSDFKVGAPFNTKSAVRYNDLLKHKGLDKQYESIIEGDKIFIINLKNNPYKIDTIAIPNNKIPPEIDKFIRDYWDLDEIFESALLNKLKELYKDLNWSFPSLNSNINKFFKFS